MDLSIIIINWNSAGFVEQCLTTVYRNVRGLTFEVVVVDNASWDTCAGMIAEHFPSVRFIQNDKNTGFSHANNLGVGYCSGRNVLFLNPDTEIVGTALQTMVSFLDHAADCGIAGPTLFNSDRTIQTSCIQPFPSILNQLLDFEFLQRAFAKLPIWRNQALFTPGAMPSRVEVVSGACLMIKRTALQGVGGFDERYFMYAEDADLCSKVRDKGWSNYYIPDASVIHHGGGSSNAAQQSHFASVTLRESIFKFMRARRGRHYATAFRCSMICTSLVRICALVILLTLGGKTKRPRLRHSFVKWVKLLRWTVGLEPWVRDLHKRA